LNDVAYKLLLMACGAALCILLPVEYLRKEKEDLETAHSLKRLEAEIQEAESMDFSLEGELTRIFSQRKESFPSFRGQRLLAGTSFYEVHEIEEFVVRKFEDKDKPLEIHPPLSVTARRMDAGIELAWKQNPRNETLLKKLMNNPLLSLNYKVYRWNSGRHSRPEVVSTLSYDHNNFIDNSIGLLGLRYYYNIVAAYGGRIGKVDTLIESRQSETVEVACPDRFKIRIVDGKPGRVQVEVTLEEGDTVRSHVFSISEGDEIGGWIETPDGTFNLSTSLLVKAIRVREEEREESVERPVFNSDGSRSLDPLTRRPLFEKRPIVRNHTIYSLECEDPWGNPRILE